tara:strand:- start:384 stop:629 length:246 start_codon:yes stop_codon:yes gene_type:complete
MKVNRFINKAQYKTKPKSIFHTFLLEEGYNRKYLSYDLNLSPATIDKYLEQPECFTVKHIKSISEETGVDANFIINLIYEN